MDPNHYHELEENDLAAFLINFRQWWNKYGNTLLAVILIAATVFLGKRWYDSSRAAAHEAAWSDLALATSPGAFRDVAATHPDPTVQALARLRGADLLLLKASQLSDEAAADADPSSQDDEPAPTSPANTDDALQKAAVMYRSNRG